MVGSRCLWLAMTKSFITYGRSGLAELGMAAGNHLVENGQTTVIPLLWLTQTAGSRCLWLAMTKSSITYGRSGLAEIRNRIRISYKIHHHKKIKPFYLIIKY